ncbi:hypothetical protein GCM10028803_15810 [Larkinella knui]|uniref:Aminoglycoside phosphotransferase domain-containing protein n=1 Tax=Larkinella knui TaxID=2025310 RepID=A0A3P1C9F8_9BACT|nr:phosphotransferase [Larkinella knui]RRB09950.1 hypothetical protein EHT87_31010 [Larkinella knui]
MMVDLAEIEKIAKLDLNINAVYIEPIQMGVMTYKYLIKEKDRGEYIIRFYPDNLQRVINFEPQIIKRFYLLGAKVPKILSDSQGKKVKYNYILYKKLSGDPLIKSIDNLPLDSLKLIISSLCDNLAIMRRLNFKGFGPLISDIYGQHPTWKSYIESSIKEGVENLHFLRLGNFTNEKIKQYVNSNICSITKLMSEPKLVWTDINPDNIIVNDRQLSGIIDFDGVISGNPIMEIGYLYCRQGNSNFFKYYLEKCKYDVEIRQEIVYFFTIFRVLQIAKYWQFPLPTGLKRDPLENVFPGFIDVINKI